jgi:hypothetical protein
LKRDIQAGEILHENLLIVNQPDPIVVPIQYSGGVVTTAITPSLCYAILPVRRHDFSAIEWRLCNTPTLRKADPEPGALPKQKMAFDLNRVDYSLLAQGADMIPVPP